jgi:quinol monooxygenase YgiN
MTDFAHSITIAASAARVHETAARRGNQWWTTNAVVDDRVGGICTFRFPSAGFHAAFRVIVNTPETVGWQCFDSVHPRSSGFKDLHEWIGTTVRFGFEKIDERTTRLHFRHIGLVDSMECYGTCSNIWGFYLQSFKKAAESGAGEPFAGGRPGTQSEGLVCRMVPFRVHADKLEFAKATIQKLLADIEKNEPDAVVYRSYQDAADPLSFVHYMLFRSPEAHASHASSGHVSAFVTLLYPCCERTPEPVVLSLLGEAPLSF